MLGAAQRLMTPELAEFFSAYLREVSAARPPISQRDTMEWLLEGLEGYVAAVQGAAAALETVPEPAEDVDGLDPDTHDFHAHLGPREGE